MKTTTPQRNSKETHRQILGVRFFVGNAPEAVKIGVRGGLVVVPAAPALMELQRDVEYRQALQEADLAITDSGYMVMLWNLMMAERIPRVSGLEYLKLLLSQPELKNGDSVLWVMPSQASMNRNLHWLRSSGFPFEPENCYVAPKYPARNISDHHLVNLINVRRPRHVIVALGGGVQERLGLYLKRRCHGQPSIHCLGAAIGFLSGDQVRIPDWADEWLLGWLFRCASDPGRFVPRYTKALKLGMIMWRYRSRMPELEVAKDLP